MIIGWVGCDVFVEKQVYILEQCGVDIRGVLIWGLGIMGVGGVVVRQAEGSGSLTGPVPY